MSRLAGTRSGLAELWWRCRRRRSYSFSESKDGELQRVGRVLDCHHLYEVAKQEKQGTGNSSLPRLRPHLHKACKNYLFLFLIIHADARI